MTTMTTPQTFAKGVSADIRLAAMIEAEVRMQLADMASIRQYITYARDVTGSGSDTVRVRYADVGAKTPFASIGDGSALTASDMDGSVANITVARSGLQYDVTDLFVMTGFGRDLDPFRIAERMSYAAEARIMEIICATFDSAVSSVGSSGVDMSVDNFMDAIYALELANNPTPYLCVLHPRQLADLQAALRAENNNFLSFSAQTEAMSAAKAPGFVGSLLGVDIFKSDYVNLNGGSTDYIGCMFSQPGIGYAIGTAQPLAGALAELRPAGPPVTIAMERNEGSGITEIVGHLYCGAAMLETDRCVKLVTDA